MSVDYLSDAFNTMKTHEHVGQRECSVRASKLIGSILQLLKDNGYLKEYKFIEDNRGGLFSIELAGRINGCGVIKPRFPVRHEAWPVVEQQYIPGIGIGLLIVSTSQGIMTNVEAEKRQIGGRLLAYIY